MQRLYAVIRLWLFLRRDLLRRLMACEIMAGLPVDLGRFPVSGAWQIGLASTVRGAMGGEGLREEIGA